jgi:hypothetical protein
VVLFSLFFFKYIVELFSLSRFTFTYFFIYSNLISLFLLFTVSPLLADVVWGHNIKEKMENKTFIIKISR